MVRAGIDDILVNSMAFEVRYDEGFRYLDHCGAALVAIQQNTDWTVPSAGLGGANLTLEAEQLTAKFDQRSVAVSTSPSVSLGLDDARKRAAVLSKESEQLYEIVAKHLNVPNATRVGVRFTFAAISDSVEEADLFLVKATRSDVVDQLVGNRQSVVQVDMKVTTQDDAGYRQHTRIFSGGVSSNAIQYMGFPEEGITGMVVVDVDTFTKPPRGHFENSGRFLIDSFGKASIHAQETFRWMRTKQA